MTHQVRVELIKEESKIDSEYSIYHVKWQATYFMLDDCRIAGRILSRANKGYPGAHLFYDSTQAQAPIIDVGEAIAIRFQIFDATFHCTQSDQHNIRSSACQTKGFICTVRTCHRCMNSLQFMVHVLI